MCVGNKALPSLWDVRISPHKTPWAKLRRALNLNPRPEWILAPLEQSRYSEPWRLELWTQTLGTPLEGSRMGIPAPAGV